MAQYTVYKVVNRINNKYYIGLHKTKEPCDLYMGSGHLIKAAIKKYGIKNFSKEILFIFNTLEEASLKEAELVNATDPLSYNLKCGGLGGWDCCNQKEFNKHYVKRSNTTKEKMKNNHWSRSKFRNETINKFSNKNRKKIIIDGIVYPSLKDACIVLNMSKSTVHRRVNSFQYPNWNYVEGIVNV